ncbi:hybrid sensor histidine kinase/response regulator [Burkholderia glumae]|uniref:hybrid sensor histidine kinase/response regulator n=1 Tax=Burkholderia glumae TaxID=337 RepID=UPI002150F498|nr:ATP-binding protein [Burkholderia glumae]
MIPERRTRPSVADGVDEASEIDRFVIDTWPVGMMIYALPSGELLIENSAAKRLIDAGQHDAGRSFFERIEPEWERVNCGAADPLVELDWPLSAERTIRLGVTMSRTRYAGQEALLLVVAEFSCPDRAMPHREREGAASNAVSEVGERESHAVPSLLAVVSHEVRTPLHGAMGNLELLAYSPLMPEQRERVVTIRHTLDELLGLLDDLLEVEHLKRLGDDPPLLHLTPTRLDELAEHCAQVFAPVARSRGLALYCLTDPALDAPAQVDARRLTRILHNLLGNAVKFTKRGEIVLSVHCLNTVEQHGWVRFEVRDTGIGIPAEAQAAIFEPHRQADATISHRFGGSGLGLFLCRRLVELMGGRMTLASKPGEGSVFGVELPVALLDAPRHGQPLATRRVELICEHAAWRDALARRLVAWGATVEDAPRLRAAPSLRVQAGEVRDDREWPVPHFGTLRITPDGPLAPRRTGDGVEVGPLSNRALLQALMMLIDGDGWAEPSSKRQMKAPATVQMTEVVEMKKAVAMASKQEQQAPNHFPPLDLLVIDDDAVSLTLIRHQLATLGQTRVRVARDGREALTAWSERHFDAVITDIDLPCLNGTELLAVLRKYDEAAIVIAMTAFAAEHLGTGSRLFSHVLRKPAALQDLQRVLNDVQRTIRPYAVARSLTDTAAAARETHRDSMLLVPRDTFAKSCSITRARLAAATASHDRAKLKRCLHSFEGALSIMGYDALASTCAALHAQCEQADWETLELRCTILIAEIERLVSVGPKAVEAR